jgi:dolichyl-phosphate beta-glucosyltransferase
MSRARLYAAPTGTISGPRVTAFDVELLVVARRQGLKVCVRPVVWTYGEQSKVNPIRDTWTNLLDVLKVRSNDSRGRYRSSANKS